MAKKQLIVSGASQMPAAVRKLWGPPPILPNADPEVYWKLAAAMLRDVQPGNVVELMYLKDIVDDTWEIRELRTHKAQLTNVEQIKSRLVSDEGFVSDMGQSLLFLNRLDRVETLNKLLESALARRAASLREIENVRDLLASRLRKASDDAILDGEFTEHDPGPSAAADGAAVAQAADQPGPEVVGDTVPQPAIDPVPREVA
jgi:hypothetical protein